MDIAPSRSKRLPVHFIWLTAIAVYAVLVRCLHLFDHNHYYILSPDSYFFHWQAERALDGQSVFLTWQSGLTYPLAYLARVIGFVSGMAPADALTLAGKLLPLALGVVGLLVIYVAASTMYDRRVGLWTAFCFAILNFVFFVQAPGYLDRDGMSMLLLMTGVFVFHFSSDWRLRVAGKDVAWAARGLAVLVIEGLLFLEWGWLGSVLLVAVLVGSALVELFVPLVVRFMQTPGKGGPAYQSAKQFFLDALAAVKTSDWLALSSILVVSVVGAFSVGIAKMYDQAVYLARHLASGTSDVAELRPMTVDDLFAVGFLIIPLAVGSYIMVFKGRKADLLCLGWFASLFALGVFARRMFVYAAPAICIVCGVGLAAVFDFARASRSPSQIRILGDLLVGPSPRALKMCGAVILLLALLLTSTLGAFNAGSGRVTAPDDEWQSALTYLKENSPEDAVVMSWWDYGYWILDLAKRRPVVDNGMYFWDVVRLRDVALAYICTDPSEAAQAMRRWGADYLVFSQTEGLLSAIPSFWPDESRGVDSDPVLDDLKDSLYYQSLYRGFQSGGGLTRVYPSAEAKTPKVVILALEEGQG